MISDRLRKKALGLIEARKAPEEAKLGTASEAPPQFDAGDFGDLPSFDMEAEPPQTSSWSLPSPLEIAHRGLGAIGSGAEWAVTQAEPVLGAASQALFGRRQGGALPAVAHIAAQVPAALNRMVVEPLQHGGGAAAKIAATAMATPGLAPIFGRQVAQNLSPLGMLRDIYDVNGESRLGKAGLRVLAEAARAVRPDLAPQMDAALAKHPSLLQNEGAASLPTRAVEFIAGWEPQALGIAAKLVSDLGVGAFDAALEGDFGPLRAAIQAHNVPEEFAMAAMHAYGRLRKLPSMADVRAMAGTAEPPLHPEIAARQQAATAKAIQRLLEESSQMTEVDRVRDAAEGMPLPKTPEAALRVPHVLEQAKRMAPETEAEIRKEVERRMAEGSLTAEQAMQLAQGRSVIPQERPKEDVTEELMRRTTRGGPVGPAPRSARGVVGEVTAPLAGTEETFPLLRPARAEGVGERGILEPMLTKESREELPPEPIRQVYVMPNDEHGYAARVDPEQAIQRDKGLLRQIQEWVLDGMGPEDEVPLRTASGEALQALGWPQRITMPLKEAIESVYGKGSTPEVMQWAQAANRIHGEQYAQMFLDFQRWQDARHHPTVERGMMDPEVALQSMEGLPQELQRPTTNLHDLQPPDFQEYEAGGLNPFREATGALQEERLGEVERLERLADRIAEDRDEPPPGTVVDPNQMDAYRSMMEQRLTEAEREIAAAQAEAANPITAEDVIRMLGGEKWVDQFFGAMKRSGSKRLPSELNLGAPLPWDDLAAKVRAMKPSGALAEALAVYEHHPQSTEARDRLWRETVRRAAVGPEKIRAEAGDEEPPASPDAMDLPTSPRPTSITAPAPPSQRAPNPDTLPIRTPLETIQMALGEIPVPEGQTKPKMPPEIAEFLRTLPTQYLQQLGADNIRNIMARAPGKDIRATFGEPVRLDQRFAPGTAVYPETSPPEPAGSLSAEARQAIGAPPQGEKPSSQVIAAKLEAQGKIEGAIARHRAQALVQAAEAAHPNFPPVMTEEAPGVAAGLQANDEMSHIEDSGMGEPEMGYGAVFRPPEEEPPTKEPEWGQGIGRDIGWRRPFSSFWERAQRVFNEELPQRTADGFHMLEASTGWAHNLSRAHLVGLNDIFGEMQYDEAKMRTVSKLFELYDHTWSSPPDEEGLSHEVGSFLDPNDLNHPDIMRGLANEKTKADWERRVGYLNDPEVRGALQDKQLTDIVRQTWDRVLSPVFRETIDPSGIMEAAGTPGSHFRKYYFPRMPQPLPYPISRESREIVANPMDRHIQPRTGLLSFREENAFKALSRYVRSRYANSGTAMDAHRLLEEGGITPHIRRMPRDPAPIFVGPNAFKEILQDLFHEGTGEADAEGVKKGPTLKDKLPGIAAMADALFRRMSGNDWLDSALDISAAKLMHIAEETLPRGAGKEVSEAIDQANLLRMDADSVLADRDRKARQIQYEAESLGGRIQQLIQEGKEDQAEHLQRSLYAKMSALNAANAQRNQAAVDYQDKAAALMRELDRSYYIKGFFTHATATPTRFLARKINSNLAFSALAAKPVNAFEQAAQMVVDSAVASGRFTPTQMASLGAETRDRLKNKLLPVLKEIGLKNWDTIGHDAARRFQAGLRDGVFPDWWGQVIPSTIQDFFGETTAPDPDANLGGKIGAARRFSEKAGRLAMGAFTYGDPITRIWFGFMGDELFQKHVESGLEKGSAAAGVEQLPLIEGSTKKRVLNLVDRAQKSSGAARAKLLLDAKVLYLRDSYIPDMAGAYGLFGESKTQLQSGFVGRSAFAYTAYPRNKLGNLWRWHERGEYHKIGQAVGGMAASGVMWAMLATGALKAMASARGEKPDKEEFIQRLWESFNLFRFGGLGGPSSQLKDVVMNFTSTPAAVARRALPKEVTSTAFGEPNLWQRQKEYSAFRNLMNVTVPWYAPEERVRKFLFGAGRAGKPKQTKGWRPK